MVCPRARRARQQQTHTAQTHTQGRKDGVGTHPEARIPRPLTASE